MTIAKTGRAIPLVLRLDHAKKQDSSGFARVVLACAAVLKWGWWHAKAYIPIVGLLLLTVGSLVVLQCHWLYRRLALLSVREKEVLKNAG